MFTISRGIDIHFAHHIRGHDGACIHIHGHTWRFEVVVAAETLDAQGFVVDFKRLTVEVLGPAHRLLDHALAMGRQTFEEIGPYLVPLGEGLLASRAEVHPARAFAPETGESLHGAENRYPGGLKIATFEFSPTSERLAQWLWGLAHARLADERVKVVLGRIYETMHPVESVAEYRP